ncbi:MAG: nicotinate phosphoribosyltransferase [Clostridia bacterium]
MKDIRNLTMLTDFYELTMANGYFENDMSNQTAYFDMFFRKVPDDGGYAIMAGLEQLIDYLKNIKFTDDDIKYLEGKNIFSKGFLEYLRNFEFACDVYAVKEGTPIFPGEPIITVSGPMIQAQFIETALLVTINHQSLIATKANRIVKASDGRAVIEFGARRAQGYDSAVLGARSAYIGGCKGTSCVMTDRDYGVPAGGTMAHSWVQMFDNEYDAFTAYAKIYPNECVFLVDTYNVLKSGVPTAIKVFDEYLKPRGLRPKSIRLDSGDIAYLSKKARIMLDEAGYEDVTIMASNSLDEYLIRDLLNQGAKIDSFGIGERLITAKSDPVFGGVYKLCAVKNKQGEIIPKIKVSENVEKITTPHVKQLYRFFDNKTGKAIADVITIFDEVIDDSKPYKLFDPTHVWKSQTVTDYTAKKLLEPIFLNGKCVYESPGISEIRDYCKEQTETLWEEVSRFENPQLYFVDLSQKLWDIKFDMLRGN